MKNIFTRIISILFILLTSLSVALAAEGPKAFFPDTRFDFGKVMQGKTVEHEFVLKNEGTTTLRILGVSPTAPLKLSRFTAQINPGAELRIPVQLDTSKLRGQFKGKILLSLNDPALPEASLSFEGRVITPIELSPRSAFYVAGRRGEHRQAVIEIINHDPEPLRIESVEHPKERFSTKLDTIEEGRRYRLSLILKPDGPGGKNTDAILVKTSSRTAPLIKIPANTYLRERVYTFPDEVDLGALRLADIKAQPDLLQRTGQTLMVYQWGGKDFQVSLTSDIPALDLKGKPGPKGDRWQFTVTLLKDKITPGPIKGNIFIKTNDPQFPTLTVPVTGAILGP
jgi:hypothetical protein